MDLEFGSLQVPKSMRNMIWEQMIERMRPHESAIRKAVNDPTRFWEDWASQLDALLEVWSMPLDHCASG